jgi:hypothetical protein
MKDRMEGTVSETTAMLVLGLEGVVP